MLESQESCHAHQFPVDNYIPPHVCASQSSNNSTQHQFILSHSDDSVGSNVCRICHHPSNVDEALVAPCRCKGTLAYVHMSCLEHWLNQSCRNRCELCHFRFNAIETLRYRWSESLRIWMSHPRNRRYVQSDILVLGLLTVVTIGLVAVCLLAQYSKFHDRVKSYIVVVRIVIQ
ncbi:hypothetical protein PV327_002682 [Microctonus hyperodae]|uniref:RING-CH-type domain-containing protein n=1 Tax=Microctonus hyperodae TaxID=165561 RepID=A0AA39KPM7_MICHY|nr:hypothetical protein PV327_002682 [Microctonus hyperodae]